GDGLAEVAGIENFINSKVDAIIDGAIDTAALAEVIGKAEAAGIPFMVESGFWRPGVTCMVGQDSFRMGQVQGTYIAERLNGKGNVVILTYHPARNIAMREEVCKAILAQYPEIKIVANYTIEISRVVDEARKTMETLLVRYPKPGDISAVWCGWDDIAMGAAAAIDAAGRSSEMFCIGNDAGQEAMDKIRGTSAFDVTVYVDYATIGKIMFQQLDKVFATGKADANNIYIDLPLVTRDNVPPPGQWPPPVSSYILYRGN
ncbi:MAG: sugar ABC transporter substrate-binding protein, partial [Firmicutes bacterium]|nr:sugar ABC transporter substrate-binding protein [Bacillota bacterium]